MAWNDSELRIIIFRKSQTPNKCFSTCRSEENALKLHKSTINRASELSMGHIARGYQVSMVNRFVCIGCGFLYFSAGNYAYFEQV